MSDTDRLADIEARCEAATKGPWECQGVMFPDSVPYSAACIGPENGGVIQSDSEYHGIEGRREDFEFIAHARTDIPYLIARIRQLEGGQKVDKLSGQTGQPRQEP